MPEIELINVGFNKSKFNTITNNDFSFFKKEIVADDSISLDMFFKYYDDLFHQIPKEGDVKSHNYILNKTLEYLNLSLAEEDQTAALIEEITRLKNELLELNTLNLNG